MRREVVEQDRRIYEKYRASWTDESGEVRRRTFSIDRYGEREAKRRAVEARKMGVVAADEVRRRNLLDVLHMHREVVANGVREREIERFLHGGVSLRPDLSRVIG